MFYAKWSSSQAMRLVDQLFENQGTRSITEYLGFIHSIVDELSILDSLLPPPISFFNA